MIRHGLLFFLVLFPLLALLSCTKEQKEIATRFPEFFNLTSDDGFLTLEIPGDIWSEDDEITITAVPLDQLPEPLKVLRGAGVGYKFEPAGFTFSRPVRATWEIDTSDLQGWPTDGADMYGLVTLDNEGDRQVLPGVTTDYTIGDKSLKVSGVYTGADYIGRTRSSLTARLPAFGRPPVAGQMFTAAPTWSNTDMSGTVTLTGLSARYEVSGAVSLQGDDTTASDDLPPGESFTDSREFKCEAAGAGSISFRLSGTSLVKNLPSVPLHLSVGYRLECAEETATTPEPEINLPENLITYLDAWGFKTADQLAGVDFSEDPENDHIYGDPNQPAGFTPGYTDLTGVFRAAVNLSREAALTLTTAYTCGAEREGLLTVCGPGAGVFPDGEAYVVGGILREPFLTTITTIDRQCVIAAVFNGGTEFQAQAPFTWDFFQKTSHWFELSGSVTGWNLLPSSVNDQGIPRNTFPSSARFFIDQKLGVVGGIISRAEIPNATGYRAAVDCHNQAFEAAQSGGDVPGANPTEALTPLPTRWVNISNLCGGKCLPRPPEEPEAVIF
jgi:hypothetical protein